MIGLAALWLPILLSAVVVFLASSVIHMMTPWHKGEYRAVPDEDGVMKALRPFAIPPGDYMMPSAPSMEAMKSPEFLEKKNLGPNIIMTVVPNASGNWRPHPKSTPAGTLAQHITNLIGFGALIAVGKERDVAPVGGPPYVPVPFTSTATMLDAFDTNVAASRTAIAGLTESALVEPWALNAGAHTIFSMPRAAVLRTYLLNHIIHHRGQLSVYLRLLDVPLPSIYGPTADEAR